MLGGELVQIKQFLAKRPLLRLGPAPASYSSVTPKRFASVSTASMNVRPSVSRTKVMASPALPQPKHL